MFSISPRGHVHAEFNITVRRDEESHAKSKGMCTHAKGCHNKSKFSREQRSTGEDQGGKKEGEQNRTKYAVEETLEMVLKFEMAGL